MPKLDHRDTDERLRHALLGLLETESIYQVQVRELCAKAHINRTTFYKHYDDMGDFVRALETEFLDRMNAEFYFGNVFLHALDFDAQQTFLQCVGFMTENGDFARAFFGRNGSPVFKGKIQSMWADQVEEALLLRAPRVQERINLEMFSACVAASMMSLLEIVLSQPVKYDNTYFADQMTLVLYDHLLKGIVE